MKKIVIVACIAILNFACKSSKSRVSTVEKTTDFTIAFGSCNKHDLENFLWDDILNAKPNVWIWGGDIIYADTDDMSKMKSVYKAQNAVEGYKELRSKVPVIGTWDDHDYGLNDGGIEFKAKRESQQEFLDFMGVAADSPRRKREGVYAVHNFNLPEGKIKVIVLDTRYFRTAITPDTETKKRLKPNVYGEGSVLGGQQWKWLEKELNSSKAEFNVIVSSVQFLSKEHGFEGWGNFPHEVDRLKQLVVSSKAKGAMILSGDRHISEFSRTKVEALGYPLVDFTSSGLTHVYSDFTGEDNAYRVGEVVFVQSFGIVEINVKTREVLFKMVGNEGEILGMLKQQY
ncbi:MAG: alkaline phosphatase D family protein [Cellulophaga sp.]